MTTFLVVVNLQTNLGYSALEAGAALLPITVIMLGVVGESRAVLAQRIGRAGPMTIGPFVVAAGLASLARIEPGSSYGTGVLPGVVVLGFGLAVTVSPLTAAVLAAVDDHHAGIGSAINNAAARIAALLAIAAPPGVVGLEDNFAAGYEQALQISAVLAAIRRRGVVAHDPPTGGRREHDPRARRASVLRPVREIARGPVNGSRPPVPSVMGSMSASAAIEAIGLSKRFGAVTVR